MEQPREASVSEEVVRFLSTASPHRGRAPVHIETHLSHVFLVGDRALKMKKPVRWSVVDYGTLARREAACRREFEVNRPFAPGLYRAVVPVTREGDGFAIDGRGSPVEWLVVMERFPESQQLDVMVDEGTITPEIIDDAAEVIAAMHCVAPVRRTRSSGAAATARSRQLHDDVRAGPITKTADANAAAWFCAVEAAVATHRGRLDRRGRHGFVRRCHGDLHLSNLCVWEGRAVPFDAIEFSEELATIDVMDDLAFVLLDLRTRGRVDLSTRLLSRYLEATRDYGGLALLSLFQSQRAMVRALTRAAKGRDPAPMIVAARDLIRRPATPRLVAVGGLSGSGKTTIARHLAPRLDAVVIRSDTIRKRLAGVPLADRLERGAYTAEAAAAVYRRMCVDARRALRAGATVVLDATFTDPATRAAVESLAQGLDVPFDSVWLETSADTLAARVDARSGDASDADRRVIAAQLARDVGPLDWARIDASGPPETVTERVAAALARSA